MQIDGNRLLENPPPDFGPWAPWVPVKTFAAANFLRVHPKTLLRWHRLGIGPEPVDRDEYLCNQLYWLPARLRIWWEAQVGLPARSFNDICEEWARAHPSWVKFRLEMPDSPKARHLRRRNREQRDGWSCR